MFSSIITILAQVMPLISQFITFIKGTPEEKRADVIAKLHDAFAKANQTGDTSDIENIIKKGK